MAAISSLNI